jgi:hypothetical protein
MDYPVVFNKQFNILLEDLKNLAINTDKESYDMLKSCSDSLVLKNFLPKDFFITQFHTFITIPFGEQLKKNNDEFFLSYSYSEYDKKFSVSNTSNLNNVNETKSESNFEQNSNSTSTSTSKNGLQNFVENIKNIWKNHMTDTQKDIIRTRLNVCVKISEKWHLL